MGVNQSESLRCECGSEQFLAVVKLVTSPGGGTTPSPGGYQCQQCHGVADIGQLVKRVKARHLRAQMDEMRAELGEDVVKAPPAMVVKVAPGVTP